MEHRFTSLTLVQEQGLLLVLSLHLRPEWMDSAKGLALL
jgi:hypothetical protein